MGRVMKQVILLICLMMIGCSSTEDIVRKGHLDFDKSTTVENAFNGYKFFKEKKWSSFEDSQKRKVVEFEGIIDLMKVTEEYKLKLKQYVLDAGLIRSFGFKKSALHSNNLSLIVQFIILENDNFKVSYVGLKNKLEGTIDRMVINKSADLPLNKINDIYNNQVVGEMYDYAARYSRIDHQKHFEEILCGKYVLDGMTVNVKSINKEEAVFDISFDFENIKYSIKDIKAEMFNSSTLSYGKLDSQEISPYEVTEVRMQFSDTLELWFIVKDIVKINGKFKKI